MKTKLSNFFLNKPSTNPSTTGVTTTPPHPKYQNNNITNTQMKMSKNYLNLNHKTNKLGRKS